MASTAFDRVVRASGRPGTGTARGPVIAPAGGAAIVRDVDAALRNLTSHGASRGWTGRRDRALLVLSQVAGLATESIIELTAGDITVSDGVATIRTPGGTTTLRRADDVLLCGPCALARWLHALDLTVSHPGQVAASIIARCAPLTARSPHLCEGELILAPATRRMPVLTVTDSWGPYPAAIHLPSAVSDRTPEADSEPAARRSQDHRPADVGAARGAAGTRSSVRDIACKAPVLPQQTASTMATRPGSLRLSRYSDPMEPAAAQRLRRNLDRTAGELAAWEVSRQQGGSVTAARPR